MNSKLEQTTSYWMETGEIVVDTAPTADMRIDVCIVGAGIAGLTTAYLLLKVGKSVVILDDGPVGGGQTERTTAHLSNAIDDQYTEIEGWHGQDGAKRAVASHTAAIDTIEAIVAREGIDCDFERLDGFLSSTVESWPELLIVGVALRPCSKNSGSRRAFREGERECRPSIRCLGDRWRRQQDR